MKLENLIALILGTILAVSTCKDFNSATPISYELLINITHLLEILDNYKETAENFMTVSIKSSLLCKTDKKSCANYRARVREFNNKKMEIDNTNRE